MNIPYVFKRCSKCGEWLVANNYNFSNKKRGKWGLHSQCKKCRKLYNKKHYENNKEEIIERQKKYYENNKEEKKLYRKKHYENNKNKYKKYNKEYNKNNPEIQFNRRNRRRSKEKKQGRGITKEQWKEMMEFFQWKCAYSDISLGNKNIRSVDHIVALDNGGLNEVWNCIPMVKGYNCSKRNRIDIFNWYMEQEYFDEERLNKIVEWQIYAYEKWGGEEFGELILITDLFEEEK